MPLILSAPLWLLLFSAGLAVTFLPRWAEVWLGPRFGRLVLGLGGFKRRIAEENIRNCYPELGPRERRRLLVRNFEHYGALFFDYLHLFSPFPGHFRDYAGRVSILEGAGHWKKAHEKGKGVIFMSSHVGFWEMSAAAAGLAGYEPLIVTSVLSPRWLHDKITACRLSTGVRAAFHPGSGLALLRQLKKGGAVALMNDQYTGPPMGMPVPFFGVDVDTLAAIAPLAEKTGAAILPVYCYRDAAGLNHVVIEPEIEPGPASGDVRATTATLAAKVESWVRRHPEQWLWIHRRFKNVVWPARQEPVPQGAA